MTDAIEAGHAVVPCVHPEFRRSRVARCEGGLAFCKAVHKRDDEWPSKLAGAGRAHDGLKFAVRRVMAAPNSRASLAKSNLDGRRVLVCLDRSILSEVCIPHATALAETFGGGVTLAHVMEPHRDSGGPQANDALGWEISRQEARGYLERVQAELAQVLGQPVDIRLEQGRPATRIVGLVHEIGAEIAVLGGRGAGGATSGSLGSTTQEVLSLARCSVLVAHRDETSGASSRPKRILVPLDGSIRTESVLPTAVRMARVHGAALLLAHVVQETPLTPLLTGAADRALARTLAARLEEGAEGYLRNLQQQLAHELGEVQTLVVRHANERQCLLTIAAQERIDLVLLTAHGAACNPARSFGSVATFLLTHSSVPVLALQDLPAHEAARASEATDGVSNAPSLRASYAGERI